MRKGILPIGQYSGITDYLKMLDSIKDLMANYVEHYHKMPNYIVLHPDCYERINKYFIDYCNADGRGYSVFGISLLRSEDLQEEEFIIF